MPETPDFDQLTVDLATRAGRGDILPHIKDALRQVWNARGAADIEVVAEHLAPSDDGRDLELERMLRILDR